MSFHRVIGPTILLFVLGLPFLPGGVRATADKVRALDANGLTREIEKIETFLDQSGPMPAFDQARMEALRLRAVELKKPVLAARVRLISGTLLGQEEALAHLELAAESFHQQKSLLWEAKARLQLGRNLERYITSDLWGSGLHDRALEELRRAFELARMAGAQALAGESQQLLGRYSRIENSFGPAVDHLEKAAEAFDAAGLPVEAARSRLEAAAVYDLLGQTGNTEAVLRSALAVLPAEASLDTARRMIARLHPPGRRPPDPAAFRKSDAAFRKALDSLQDVVSPERLRELKEMFDHQSRQRESAMSGGPPPSGEPPYRMQGPYETELIPFLRNHTDREYVERALKIAIKLRLDELKQETKTLQVEQRLSGQRGVWDDTMLKSFESHARRTGQMPDLPPQWFDEQLRRAPEAYRRQGAEGLSMWLELRAAEAFGELRMRLGRPPQIPEGQAGPGTPQALLSSWMGRFCQGRNAALERLGLRGTGCVLRNVLPQLADDLGPRDTEVSLHYRIEAKKEQSRQLTALLKVRSIGEDRIRTGLSSPDEQEKEFWRGLFFRERHPWFLAPDTVMMSIEESIALLDALPANEEAARQKELRGAGCVLTYEIALRERLAGLLSSHGFTGGAAEHRSRIAQVRAAARFKTWRSQYAGNRLSWVRAEGSALACPRHLSPESAEGGDAESFATAKLGEAESKLAGGDAAAAVAIFQSFQDVERPELRAVALAGLGRAHLRKRNARQAFEAYRGAIDAIEEVAGRLQGTRRIAAYSERTAGLYDEVIRLSIAAGEAERALEYVERSHARAFQTDLGSLPLRLSGVPEDLQERESLLRGRLIRLENLSQGLGLPRASQKEEARRAAEVLEALKETRQEYDRLMERIQSESPRYARLVSSQVPSVTEIRRHLPAGTVLLEYHLLPEAGYAWVVGPAKTRLVKIGAGRREIEARITALREEITSRGAYRPRAAALYTDLIAPVEPHLRGHNVLLVLQGSLQNLPFAALWNPAASRHLAEEMRWSTLPSASALALTSQRRPRRWQKALVLGDPESQRPSRALPAAEAEARAVARILETAPVLGAQARESVLRERVPAADLLHIAAHADFEPGNPLFSRIALAPEPGSAAAPERDGALEVREILNMDLRHLGLVTLSACETGQGRDSTGDGATSLSRAFLVAGAASVVATLWRIEDESSSAWSQAFYRRLKKGEPAASALQGAQTDLARQERWSHPYFWAGFLVSGAPALTAP